MEQSNSPRGGISGAYERENQLFERVWPRVDERTERTERGTPSAPAETKEDGLRRAIEGELADWKTYNALSARGAGRQIFFQIAAEELRHARRLSAAYFTERAVRYFPWQEARAEQVADLMTALRERILHEREGAETYRRMAQAERGAIKQLLEALAADEERHAARLTALLESWM